MVTTCPDCGLCYAEERAGDKRIHNRLHRQWLEIAPTWGINPSYPQEAYERDKSKCRAVFNGYDGNEHSLHERVDAAISYLHVQWIQGLWGSIRRNEYAKFLKKYPAIHIWIQENYDWFRHEFTNDIQVAIRCRYNIQEVNDLPMPVPESEKRA